MHPNAVTTSPTSCCWLATVQGMFKTGRSCENTTWLSLCMLKDDYRQLHRVIVNILYIFCNCIRLYPLLHSSSLSSVDFGLLRRRWPVCWVELHISTLFKCVNWCNRNIFPLPLLLLDCLCLSQFNWQTLLYLFSSSSRPAHHTSVQKTWTEQQTESSGNLVIGQIWTENLNTTRSSQTDSRPSFLGQDRMQIYSSKASELTTRETKEKSWVESVWTLHNRRLRYTLSQSGEELSWDLHNQWERELCVIFHAATRRRFVCKSIEEF